MVIYNFSINHEEGKLYDFCAITMKNWVQLQTKYFQILIYYMTPFPERVAINSCEVKLAYETVIISFCIISVIFWKNRNQGVGLALICMTPRVLKLLD